MVESTNLIILRHFGKIDRQNDLEIGHLEASNQIIKEIPKGVVGKSRHLSVNNILLVRGHVNPSNSSKVTKTLFPMNTYK